MATLNAQTGEIRTGSMYSLDDFRKLLGWGRIAIRTARKNGLRVIREGGRCYVLGDDAMDYFKSRAEASTAAPAAAE